MTADKSETYAGPDRRRLMQKGVFSRAVNGLTARHVVDERKTYRELLAAAHEKIASTAQAFEDFMMGEMSVDSATEFLRALNE